MDISVEQPYLEVNGLILCLDEYQSPMFGDQPNSIDMLLLLPSPSHSKSSKPGVYVRKGYAIMGLSTPKEQSLLNVRDEEIITIY
jgi:hypothetical protein